MLVSADFRDALSASLADELVSVGRFALRGVGRAQDIYTLDPEILTVPARAKLYELEIQKQNAEKQALEETKSDIGWGSQIRSYVLDDSRIKDLRTGVETRNTQSVLDGDLDKFIEASLKSGL